MFLFYDIYTYCRIGDSAVNLCVDRRQFCFSSDAQPCLSIDAQPYVNSKYINVS